MKLVLSIFFLGVSILAGALVLNLAVSSLGLYSWYDFLDNPSQTSITSFIWLFVAYPFGLGAIAYLAGRKLFK